MSSSRGKKTAVLTSKKRKGAASSSGPTVEIRHSFLQGLFFEIVEPMYLEFTLELYSTFHLQTVMTNFDDPGTVQFCLGGLVRQLSVPEFGTALGLYTEKDFVPASATYDPSRSKASALPSSLSLAYFIALALHHQMEHRRGVISIRPYVTRLARHFGLLNISAQSSSLTLISRMSPQGISSMLSMRMIEKRRGTYPLQYRLI
ncbi:hypothetical protein GOBAR_AA13597 [Gossypium barbadense]|uniref:Uncharacterized protein n=1 Tax=Gossypium barbadense TaxID=3634 RepID=A0A2P5XUT0_GOSBA|nr:hypothetical protein GOBAR_AA13597 [Gossypium barbadense]